MKKIYKIIILFFLLFASKNVLAGELNHVMKIQSGRLMKCELKSFQRFEIAEDEKEIWNYYMKYYKNDDLPTKIWDNIVFIICFFFIISILFNIFLYFELKKFKK